MNIQEENKIRTRTIQLHLSTEFDEYDTEVMFSFLETKRRARNTPPIASPVSIHRELCNHFQLVNDDKRKSRNRDTIRRQRSKLKAIVGYAISDTEASIADEDTIEMYLNHEVLFSRPQSELLGVTVANIFNATTTTDVNLGPKEIARIIKEGCIMYQQDGVEYIKAISNRIVCSTQSLTKLEREDMMTMVKIITALPMREFLHGKISTF